jgi:hypothetical protein
MNSFVRRFLQAPLRVKLASANALLPGAGSIVLFVPWARRASGLHLIEVNAA